MRRRIVWLALFALAMAYLEAAVVVYLRELYYPEGFRFPIVIILDRLAAIEIGREAATIVMLLAAGAMAGEDRWERFLFFCLTFGIWDILYYAWLWAFLRWPPSLLTPDVLFLIPVPWVAPVLAPVLVAAMMIAASSVLLRLKAGGTVLRYPRPLWAIVIAGGLMVISSFVIDFRAALEGAAPPPFRWGLFGAGLAASAVALAVGIRAQLRRFGHRGARRSAP
ncbi:MAG: hypothetical protein ACE5JH_01230 [Acidobacteriota bacterium]